MLRNRTSPAALRSVAVRSSGCSGTIRDGQDRMIIAFLAAVDSAQACAHSTVNPQVATSRGSASVVAKRL